MNKYLIKSDIEDILVDIYKRNHKFSPLFIAKRLNITKEETVECLNDLVKDDLLKQLYVIRCSECNYSYVYTDYSKIPFNTIQECPLSHETYINEDEVELWYKINTTNIKEVKEHRKKKRKS